MSDTGFPDLAALWLEKAEESLASAESELTADRLSFAVNRLYYAVFYAATALLTLEDRKLGKHSAVRSALHKDFIRTGRMDRSHGLLYDELFHARHQGDYLPMVEFDSAIVRRQLAQAHEFVAWCEKAVQGRTPTPPDAPGAIATPPR